MSILEIQEGRLYQGTAERIAYAIDTSNVATSPSSPSATAYDEQDETDVTTTVFPTGSPSASGNVITLTLLRELTIGHTYRIEVSFNSGANVYEFYFIVECV